MKAGGWLGGGGEVDEGRSEGVEVDGGFGDAGMWGEEGGEELRGEPALEDLSERGDGARVEGDGERGMFADLVLHGPDGLVECGDGGIDGSCADDLAKVGWVVVDGERDGSGDVGGDGEGGALFVEAQGEDESASPVLAEMEESGVGAQD